MNSKQFLISLISMYIVSHASGQDNSASKGFYSTPYKTRSSGSFDKRTVLISFTYGFPNRLYNTASIKSYYSDFSGWGPVSARLEFAIAGEMGLSFIGQYAHRTLRSNSVSGSGYNAGVLYVYHFNKLIPVKKLDISVSSGIGIEQTRYIFHTANGSTKDDPTTRIRFYGSSCIRFYPAKWFGLSVEIGSIGFSPIHCGITFRL